MSLKQFLRILWVRRWVILTAGLACMLAGVIAVTLLPRRYSAETRLMLSAVATDPVSGEALSLTAARAYMPTQTELIRDYRVTGRVVDRLGWTKSPDLRAEYDSSGDKRVDFRRWLAQQVSDSTNAYPIENSNIVVIGYDSDNPEAAARMADAVRDAYVEESLAFKRSSAQQSVEWFDRQTEQLRSQLATAEARKADFERANNIVLLDDGTDADAARLQSLSGSVDTPRMVGGGGGGSSGNSQLAEIDAKIASASKTLGPNHPAIQDLQRQRAAIAATAGHSSGSSSPVSVGPSISVQVAGARARVLSQRGKVEEARRLWTDVKVLQDQYSKITARASDLRQTADSNDAGITLLGSAVPPTTPSSPKIPQILGGSIVLGLVLGLLIGLISELLNRRVRGFDDLDKLGVPLVGVINARRVAALPQ